MKEVADRLALGTAQLGMPYGIANRTGKPDLAAARSIVDTAWDAGIRYFDTAQAYGDSESVLGQALENRDAAIITKLPPKLENVSQHLRESLRRLGRATIWGVLLHREEHLVVMITIPAQDLLKLMLLPEKGWASLLKKVKIDP